MNEQDQELAPDNSSPDLNGRSQLTLLDIMVGVAIAAVTCSFWLQASREENQIIQIVYMVPTLLVFVLGGTALFSFGRRYWLQKPIDFQPGHWLLCLIGVAFVVQSLGHLVRTIGFGSESHTVTEDQSSVILLFLIQHLVLLASFLLAGILMPVRPAWRLALVTPILQSLLAMLLFGSVLLQESWFMLNSIYSLANVANNVLGIIAIVCLAVWDQVTTQHRRDWLHWLGISAMLIWNLPTIVFQVISYL